MHCSRAFVATHFDECLRISPKFSHPRAKLTRFEGKNTHIWQIIYLSNASSRCIRCMHLCTNSYAQPKILKLFHKKSTFEVEIFVSTRSFISFFIWDIRRASELSFFISEVSKKGDSVGATRPRYFTAELPRRATTDQMSAQECFEAWNLRS